MENLASFFLLWGAFSPGVFGYSNGKISAACSSMVPGHRRSAQTSAPPYAISISKSSFVPGDEIIVSLMASGDSSFEGFLLQAREVGGDVAVGHFRILDPNSQGLACNNIQNSSLSHTDKAKKQNITAIWIAAPGIGDVEFRYRLVLSVLYNGAALLNAFMPKVLNAQSLKLLYGCKCIQY
nr:putative ferric-chelate reductase 1 [Zootoca vivipara]XP_034979127.1 putative ferric-chelate reductase 1 [Zootoca vivipara]